MADADALGKTKLASYELLHRLAVGGMGEVFIARQLGAAGIERLVALKRMLPGYAERTGAVESFIDEARLAATLSHPNIVHVLDFGADDGEYFLAMELVLGHDLARISARGGDAAISRPLAAHVVGEVVRALDHVHRVCDPRGEPLGIVHRDISPSNVLISYEGDVKLMDFGIAKGASSTYRTRTGAVRGKVAYMAPEQLGGGVVDARSDLYAAGIVLWELALGRRLFTGVNDLEIASKVALAEIPRPRSIDPDFPPVLEDVLMAVLQPDPEHRLQSAQAMGEALRTYLRSTALPDPRAALGTLVQTLFAAERRSVGELIRGSSAPVATPAAAHARDEREPGATVATRVTAVPEEQRPAPPKRRVWRYAAAPALLAAGAIGGVLITSARDPDPIPNTPVTTPDAPVAIPPPLSVSEPLQPVPVPTPPPEVPPPQAPPPSTPMGVETARVTGLVRGTTEHRRPIARPGAEPRSLDARLPAISRRRLIDKLHECRTHGGLPYTMTFELRIRRDGTAQILETSPLGRVETCVRRWVANWNFGKAPEIAVGTLTLDTRKRGD